MSKNATDLGHYLAGLFEERDITLFVGAGASLRAGLPSWVSYLEGLAVVAEKYEPETAAIMKSRIKAGQMAEAASYYKKCALIPAKEKLLKLAEPFADTKFDASKLFPLATLPSQHIVTTNYDRSLLDAWARCHSRSCKTPAFGDSSLREAAFWSDFYIARIHGTVELPDSIIISTEDYQKASSDGAYSDFLRQIFTRETCLFIGFSFLDPSINAVLSAIEEKIGTLSSKHYALVPERNKGLAEKLAGLNIEVTKYDAGDDHAPLWEAIQRASNQLRDKPLRKDRARAASFDTAKRLIALSYAHLQMGFEGSALTDLVLQGIILSLLQEGKQSLEDLRDGLQRHVSLSQSEAEQIVKAVLKRLRGRGVIKEDRTELVAGRSELLNASPIEALVSGVFSRHFVREGVELSAPRDKVADVLNDVIITRGSDMGAEFAGAAVSEELNLVPTLQEAVANTAPWRCETSERADWKTGNGLRRSPCFMVPTTYATLLANTEQDLSFEEYLRHVAPYSNEDEAKAFLEANGLLNSAHYFAARPRG